MLDTEKCFGLKGGTAINLFYQPMPRLSVDIDLLYLPSDGRSEALVNIRAALSRLSDKIKKIIPGIHIHNTHEESEALRLILQLREVRIKVELSPVIRGTVFPAIRMAVHDLVEKEFGYAEVQVAAFQDVYAGKICAALDRQHPRDLFDIKILMENQGFTDILRKTFLVFLVSHRRPMAELLNPHSKDIRVTYETEFVRMANVEISVEELEQAREDLIAIIRRTLTNDELQFLQTFKERQPQWSLLGLPNSEAIARLPAVQWKQLNLTNMDKKKYTMATEKLKKLLDSLKRN